MTYMVKDTSPGDWQRFEFSNAYLHEVDNYLPDKKPSAALSGAISRSMSFMGMKADAATTVAFEHDNEFAEFFKWFNENKDSWDSNPNCIIIARFGSKD